MICRLRGRGRCLQMTVCVCRQATSPNSDQHIHLTNTIINMSRSDPPDPPGPGGAEERSKTQEVARASSRGLSSLLATADSPARLRKLPTQLPLELGLHALQVRLLADDGLDLEMLCEAPLWRCVRGATCKAQPASPERARACPLSPPIECAARGAGDTEFESPLPKPSRLCQS